MKALAAALLLGAFSAYAQMIKCVDAHGVVHYTDRAPQGCRGGEVDIRGQPPISGEVTPYREDLNAAERDFQRRQAQQERERQADVRSRESLRRQCASRQSELKRASAIRRPADADAHDARIARLQAEVAKLCR